jgi:hypothetical protein
VVFIGEDFTSDLHAATVDCWLFVLLLSCLMFSFFLVTSEASEASNEHACVLQPQHVLDLKTANTNQSQMRFVIINLTIQSKQCPEDVCWGPLY